MPAKPKDDQGKNPTPDPTRLDDDISSGGIKKGYKNPPHPPAPPDERTG